MFYTHTRLIRESESSVHEQADCGDGPEQRTCAQLIASPVRYDSWLSGHDQRMWKVARERRREAQLVELRLAATEQVHRVALVRHLRDNKVTGRHRSTLLREFHGVLDTQCAILAEHRSYTKAVSSQLCAVDLLELAGDRYGAQLVDRYERQYSTFFSMYCDRICAHADGRPYLLSSLMPETRLEVSRLRRNLLAGDRLPVRKVMLPAAPLRFTSSQSSIQRQGLYRIR